MATHVEGLREQVGRLPLPLAQVCQRALNAKTYSQQCDAAWRLWEGTLQLLGSVALAECVERDCHDRGHDAWLQKLARPNLGHWWELTRRLVSSLADAGSDRFGKVHRLLAASPSDLPSIAALHAVLSEKSAGVMPGRESASLDHLFERLVCRRSREPVRSTYDLSSVDLSERVGRSLLAAFAELLEELDALSWCALWLQESVGRQVALKCLLRPGVAEAEAV